MHERNKVHTPVDSLYSLFLHLWSDEKVGSADVRSFGRVIVALNECKRGPLFGVPVLHGQSLGSVCFSETGSFQQGGSVYGIFII